MATPGYTPTWRLEKSILLMRSEIEKTIGFNPYYDTNATLNRVYNILPNEVPTTLEKQSHLRLFGIGNGGRRNVDDTDFTEPNEVSSKDLNLYRAVPFRCVPLVQDLNATERAKYRMREVRQIDNVWYALYWLKLMTFLQNEVIYTKTNRNTGVEEPWTMDYSYLHPTPPTAPPTGYVGNPFNEINVTATAQLTITGEEIIEGINVLYEGDGRRATISELGFYLGSDFNHNVTDANNTPFSYTESIVTSQAAHYTYNGTDLSSPVSIQDFYWKIGKQDVALIG